MAAPSKYIRFEGDIVSRMIIFPAGMNHRDMAKAIQDSFPNLKPASAGFISVNDFGEGPEIQCFGRSTTLNLEADSSDGIRAKMMLLDD